VLAAIRTDVAEEKVKIDNPTQNLESYFLDVVQRARQAAAATSGATSGHRIAEYLRGQAEAKSATDRVLERLTSSPTAPVAPVVESPPAPMVDTSKLEALTKSAAPVAPAPPPVPKKELTEEELALANEKLSSLLGKKS
jgi:hypothetical protein